MKIPKSTGDRVAERVKNIAHLCASSGLHRANQEDMISKAVSGDIIECMIESAQSRYNFVRCITKSQDGKSYIAIPRLQHSNHTFHTGSVAGGQSQSYIRTAIGIGRGDGEKIGLLNSVFQSMAPALTLSLFTLTSQINLNSFGFSAVGNSRDNVEANSQKEPTTKTAESSHSPEEPNGGRSGSPETDDDGQAIIYARVSSKKQDSNEDQITRLRGVVEQREMSLLKSHSPIVDDGKTGRNFNRPGIKKVTRLAREGAFSYLLVDDIDRIGRNAAECVYYLYHLRQWGVTVITYEDGEVDLDEMKGLMVAFLKTVSSQWENETRARRAKDARVESFKNKEWFAAFKQAPLGYQKHGNWIKIKKNEAEAFRRAVDFFLATEIDGAYKSTIDAANLDRYDVSSRKLKVLLKKPVYRGVPTYRREPNPPHQDDADPVTVEDESLQIISKRQFDRVQEKIEKIEERYSGGRSSASDLQDYLTQFGFEAVVSAAQCVELRCPRPDCTAELVKNGKRMTDGDRVHNYICTNGHQRKFPQKRDLDRMKKFSEDEESEEGSDD